MLIGLISDTHIPKKAKKIPRKVFEIFKNADRVIHAGDLVELKVIKELEKIAPVLAVYGNMDPPRVRNKLPKLNSLRIYKWRIGVIHDAGIFGTEKMKNIAKKNRFNVLVFGHTHRNTIKRVRGILFVNPGSPTSPLPPFIIKPTVGLLKITKRKIEPFILEV